MRTVIAKIAMGVLALSSGSVIASTPLWEEPPKNNFHVTGGFRQDELKFAIGGLDNDPETFSKVKFRNLRIAQVTGWWDHSSPSNYYIRVNGGYGRIFSGHGNVNNFESTGIESSSVSSSVDTSTDTSTSTSSSDTIDFESEKISHQLFDSGRGYVYDFTAGVGWGVISGGGRCRMSGIAGWSYHSQNLRAFNFKSTFDLLDLVGIGRIPDLHGRYSTRWSGPFLGVDLTAEIDCNITVFGGAEWHWAMYRGKGHWRYSDLYNAHFRHHAQGTGVVGYFGFDWAPCDRWAFGVWSQFQQWSTGKGTNDADILVDNTSIDPTFPVVEDSRLRRVKWFSYSISALATYRW